jgi:hypothetical protein
MVRGTAVDLTVRADLTSKRDTGALLATDAIPDLARDNANAAWTQESPRVMPEDGSEIEARGAVVDTAISLAGLHHADVAPGIEPVGIQEKVERSVAGYDFTLLGYLDIVTPDAIRDTKTSKKSPAANDAHDSGQLTLYSLMLWATEQRHRKLYLDYLVSTKIPKAITLETSRTDVDYRAYLDRVAVAHRLILAGIFAPCNASCWWCTDRWCGYYADDCPYGRRGRSR